MARRRGSDAARSGLALLVVAVLVAALLVVGDRAAAYVAENRVGQSLQTRLGTPARPAVDIEGFPFLTQVLRRSLDSVRISADGVRTDEEEAELAHADLRLRDVTSADRFRTFTAEQVDGNATIDYPTVQQLTGQALSYAREGRVQLTTQTQLLGVPVTARVVGRPVVDVAAQTLSLAEPELRVAGVDVPESTSQALLDTLVKPVPISGIPYGLSVTGLTAQPDGLRATVTGRDVTFSR